MSSLLIFFFRIFKLVIFNRLHAISTFVDPRFKHVFAKDRITFLAKVTSWVLEEENDIKIFEKTYITCTFQDLLLE